MPNASLIQGSSYFLNKIKESTEGIEKLKWTQRLSVIIYTLRLSISVMKSIPTGRKNKVELNYFLSKILVPNTEATEADECWLFKMYEEIMKLSNEKTFAFEDLDEIKGLSLFYKQEDLQFCLQDALDNLVELFIISKQELKTPEAKLLSDYDSIISEHHYIQNKITASYIEKIQAYTWTKNYLNIHEFSRYILWLERLYIADKEDIHSFLTPIFSKFESLVYLCMEEKFSQSLEASKDPELLLKKQFYILNLLRRCILLTLTNEDLGEEFETDTILNKILLSDLFELFAKLTLEEEKQEAQSISQQVLETCVYIFLYIHGIATLTFLDNARMNLSQDYTVKTICSILMKFVKDDYKFYEMSCIIFEIIYNNKMLDEAFELIPEYINKFLLEILPNINLHCLRGNEMFYLTDVVVLAFSVLDLRIYTDDHNNIQKCMGYIISFTKKAKEVLNSLKEELFLYDFNQNSPYKTYTNEIFLFKIRSQVVHFSKILLGIMPHLKACLQILIMIKDKRFELFGADLNSILMNPLLFFVEDTFRERFFLIMKSLYNLESYFQIMTVDRMFMMFVSTTNTLEDLFQRGEKEEAMKEIVSFIKDLIAPHGGFRERFKANELKVYALLDSKTIKSLMHLEIIYYFYSQYLEDCLVSKESLLLLANNFEKILKLTLDLEVFCKKDTMRIDANRNNDLDFFSNLNTSIYTKILARNIFTSVSCTCISFPDVSEIIIPTLVEFTEKNLSFNSLSIPDITANPFPLTKQMNAFDLLLRLFPEDFSISYHSLFLSSDKVVEIIMNWIINIMIGYQVLVECYSADVLNSFENLISRWMERIALITQPLYQPYHNERDEDVIKHLGKFGEKEGEYYDGLMKLIESDVSFFENYHVIGRALPVIFANFYLLIRILLKYRDLLHKENSEENSLKNSVSKLKDKEFFDVVFEKAKKSFMKAQHSFFMLYLLLCYPDCLKIFSPAEANEIIRNRLTTLVRIGDKLAYGTEIEREEINLEEEEIEFSYPISKVDMTFPFYNEDWEKMLSYLEYSLKYFRKAAELKYYKSISDKCLDFTFELGMQFLNDFSIEQFKKSQLKKPLEITLRFRYHLLNLLLYNEAIFKMFAFIVNQSSLKSPENNNELCDKIYNIFIPQLKTYQKFHQETIIESSLSMNTREAYEPYLLLISFGWLEGESKYLSKFVEDPEYLKILIHNSNINLKIELLAYLLNIYAINAFPTGELMQIISKGLVFADPKGSLLASNYRMEVYAQLIGKEISDIIATDFNTQESSISLSDPNDSNLFFPH